MIKISQREALRLRKRVKELEDLERRRYAKWNQEFPGGVNIDHIIMSDLENARIVTAENLGYIIIAKHGYGDKQLMLYAVKP